MGFEPKKRASKNIKKQKELKENRKLINIGRKSFKTVSIREFGFETESFGSKMAI